MKIAVAGKGGAGKSYVAASLARLFARECLSGRQTGAAAPRAAYAGQAYAAGAAAPRTNYTGQVYAVDAAAPRAAYAGQVYAVDVDPCGGLGAALGFTKSELDAIKPIVDMREFIDTGEDDGALYLSESAGDGMDAQFSADADGVRYLRAARIKQAGSGCYCREFGFLQAVIGSMALDERDTLILDMGGGVEPLTRGTVKGADILLAVAEATRAGIETARAVRSLGAELGVGRALIVANKIRNEKEELLIRANFRKGELAGLIRMSQAVADSAFGVNAEHKPPKFAPSPDLEELYRNIKAIRINSNRR